MGTPRIPEIDILRSLAIILMLIFHLAFDFSYYFQASINYEQGLWYAIGKTSALLFISLSGLTITLTTQNPKRGLFILFLGFVITAITYFIQPNCYINYGILHLIGTCIILSPLLQKLNIAMSITLAVTLIITGFIISDITVSSVLLLPLGLRPANYCYLDYYPLLPWSGVFIAGMTAGKLFYSAHRSILPSLSSPKFLTFLSKHSLFIYLVHQPIFLAIINLYQHYTKSL